MPTKDKAKQRELSRRHYENNKDVYKQRAVAFKKANIVDLKAIVTKAKSVPCMDCGQTFPEICMDFDHAGSLKEANVSDLVKRSVSIKRLLAEINKCDVVCSNCHRIRTLKERVSTKCAPKPKEAEPPQFLLFAA